MPEAALYDDYVMDHIKNARNYRVLEGADRMADGSNPLCGDEMTVYVKMAGERIADIAFQCTCCGISMASASMMTELVKGARASDARQLVHEFVTLLSFAANGQGELSGPERLAMLETVRRFPSRGKCAVWPWATLERALAHRDDPVVLR
ncbi:MAG: Fe-S cluster assembly sulfur transfer protein SufU [Burkholderiales bacterium]